MRLHRLEITAFGPFAETVEVDFDHLSDAGLFLLPGKDLDDLAEGALVGGEIAKVGAHVGVVEAVERRAQGREQLKGDAGFQLGLFDRLLRIPGPVEGTPAERVEPFPGEAVPIGDGEAELVLHPLAQNDLVRVVVAERQRVGAVGALEGDLVDGEETGGHRISLMAG